MVRIGAALLSLFILAPIGARGAEYLIAPYLSFPVGEVLMPISTPSWGPHDVAAADLNGDGRADLAVVSRDGLTIEGGRALSILLSNSNPSLPLLGPAVNYRTGWGPQAVAIADLNDDGRPDVVTADAGDDSLSIFLNLGGGAMGLRRALPAGASPGALALADLNADGRRDIVLAAGTGVTIFLATGSPGSFAPGVPYPAGGPTMGVAVGLVDGDAIPDVVAVTSTPDAFAIFHGVGNGTFTLTGSPSLVHPPSGLELADMNGDGRPEAIVPSGPQSRVTVYANNGVTPFVTMLTDKVSGSAQGVIARDLNGDGNVDVAVAAQQAGNSPLATGLFYPGDGAGGLGTQNVMDVGSHMEAVAAGDFDGDGMQDLAFVGAGEVSEPSFLRTVHVVRQKSPGVFGIGTFYTHVEPAMETCRTTVEDMNRDGMPDLIVAGLGYASGQASIAVRLGTSSELWDPGTLTTIPGDLPPRAVPGDFNRDGTPDLAVTESSNSAGLTFQTYLGDGTGAITPLPASITADREPLAAGDFDRDGILDLIANAPPGLALLKGVGDGTFAFGSAMVTSNSIGAAAVGDLNRDGALDVVFSVNGLALYVSLGNGTTALGAATSVGQWATSVTLADFNEDGVLDILASGMFYVSIALGDGFGSFAPAKTLQDLGAHFGALSCAPIDLNRDGHWDVIADVAELSGSHMIDPNLRVWLGDGKGGLGSRNDYGVPEHPLGITLVDATGDGRTDVVSSSLGPFLSSKAVRHYTLKGTGPATFAFPTSIVSSPVPSTTQLALVTADFTLDGTPDAVVTHSKADGNYYATLMVGNGNGTFSAGISNILPEEPVAMDVGDLNRDGIPDIAIACGAGDAVLVELGTIADTLTVPSTVIVGLGYEFSDIAIADFNRDGKPDIAAASAGASVVLVFLGNGNGTFGPAVSASTGAGGATSIAVGDTDRDGIPDLVAAIGVGINPNSIGVMRGRGDGTFQTIRPYTVGQTPYAIVVGDLNRDGLLDAAVSLTGSPGNRYVSVVLGSPGGGFGAPDLYPISQNAFDLAWANIDGDGPRDLLVPNGFGAATTISFFHALGGGGTFSPKVDYSMGGFPISLAVADLNRDGRPDVIGALTGGSNLSVLLSAPSTVSAVAGEPAGEAPLAPHLAIRPNPATSRTVLSFRLPQPGPATVDLFDVQGRWVARLFHGRADGDLEVTWTGQSDGGERAASGVYFAKLTGAHTAVSRRLVWLR